MAYVIYNTKSKKYRIMSGDDNWGKLDDAAIFRTEKNAASKIKGQLKTWIYYSEKWTPGVDQWGRDAQKDALAMVEVWKHAVPKQVKFVEV